MKSEIAVRIFVGGLLLLPCNLLLATPATASGSPGHTTASSKPTTSDQLSSDATHMLHKVDLARKAISAKNTPEAVRDINDALSECGQLATLSKKKGQSMVVPLYSELDDTSTLGPAMSARNGKAQPNLTAPITVDDVSAQYTYVGIDLERRRAVWTLRN